MRNVLYIILGYLFISQRASQREDVGIAKRKVPKRLRIIFPFLFLRRRYYAVFDLIMMILWHLYFYSWIILSIMHKKITVYTNQYGIIFIFSMLFYVLSTMGVQKKHNEWKENRK